MTLKQYFLNINLDPENPLDYLDFLILEARENHDIGYMSITTSLLQLYLGGGDTLANTLRWMCLLLSLHTDVQQKVKCLELFPTNCIV